MSPGQLAEGMQRLHHAGTLRPAGASTSRKAHDGDLAGAQRSHPAIAQTARAILALLRGEVRDVFIAHVLDGGIRREAILREPDEPRAEVAANLVVQFT